MNKKVIAFNNLPLKLTLGIKDFFILTLIFSHYGIPEWAQGIVYALLVVRVIVSLWAFFAQEQVDLFKGD